MPGTRGWTPRVCVRDQEPRTQPEQRLLATWGRGRPGSWDGGPQALGGTEARAGEAGVRAPLLRGLQQGDAEGALAGFHRTDGICDHETIKQGQRHDGQPRNVCKVDRPE